MQGSSRLCQLPLAVFSVCGSVLCFVVFCFDLRRPDMPLVDEKTVEDFTANNEITFVLVSSADDKCA